MKGIELPINILVIVAVAIIVLLGVVALFYGSWFTGTAPVTLEAAKAQACNSISRIGCGGDTATIYMNFDANQDGTIDTQDTLAAICAKSYGTGVDDSTPNWDHLCMNRVCGMQCPTTTAP